MRDGGKYIATKILAILEGLYVRLVSSITKNDEELTDAKEKT